MNIRKQFVDFFVKNGHAHVPSSGLVPEDATLMFVNSGMVQFKKFFLGLAEPEHKNVVTVQKCLRVGGKHNDLEVVGSSPRHHTFFEMLGNFSFGHYFKEQAICYAWEFITNILSLDKNRLYITVYHNDHFSFDLWNKLTGFGESRILRIASDDNFWSMGDVGPCGPCSEIYYDHGEDVDGYIDIDGSFIGNRFVEIWNLVFMEFNRNESGDLLELPNKCIDTGMGLERISAVVSGSYDNYKSSGFSALTKYIGDILGLDSISAPHRVIADHVRAAAFLIADGIMPGNEGRSYILRKIIRRAAVFANRSGYSAPILHKAFLPMISEYSDSYMGDFYPELLRARTTIESILLQEEENFGLTLKKGWSVLQNELSNLRLGSVFSGDVAFKLYDTYGLPLEVTKDLLRDHNAKLDLAGFEKAMQVQKDNARKNWVGSGDVIDDNIWLNILSNCGETEFFGYDIPSNEGRISEVKHVLPAGKQDEHKKVYVILDATSFYAESGGQSSDTGQIKAFKDDLLIWVLDVIDVKKRAGSLFVHECIIVEGHINVGDKVRLFVNLNRRRALSANHSATHILQYALRSILGDHVAQRGSMVGEGSFRLDFSHNGALSGAQISNIEDLVNSIIGSNFKVGVNVSNLEEALASGAIGLFGEKYKDSVRVVKMGPSAELCGGTHVDATGEIRLFKIISESAIASGVRRIEAVAGDSAVNYIKKKMEILSLVSDELKCQDEEINAAVLALKAENKRMDSLNNALYIRIMEAIVSNFDKSVLLAGVFNDIPQLCVRTFAINHAKANGIICLFGSVVGSNASFCLCIPDKSEFSSIINAMHLAEYVKTIIGSAKGGGSSLVAQITCNRDHADEIISLVKNKVHSVIKC